MINNCSKFKSHSFYIRKTEVNTTELITGLMYLHKADDVEKVHLKCLKQILGVRKQTPSAAVYGEVERYPLLVLRKIAIIKYWKKSKHVLIRFYIMFLT